MIVCCQSLVVLTGGAYPALSVVSSNCFGLSILNCGLTRFELRRLLHIKVGTSVLFENGISSTDFAECS